MSTKDPEVIESLRASCNGIGMVIIEVATSAVLELFGVRSGLKEDTRLDFERAVAYLGRLRDVV